ncbi:zinc finger protein 438, partial [Acomys russatus]|uniref:zinc finger protein 438 n=1 Tax=Acomys russatus TaxID=60746 RepID=UPI0021E2FCFD
SVFVIAGESNSPSGATQNGKGLQSKSQFRTIAPKIVPKVLTSRVLPCPSSFSDQRSPALTSKPLGMPTHNYALMQLAGQEGTFSLVALPNVASAQPIQKPRMSLHENVKLPIPRYQPLSSKGLRKRQDLISSKSACSGPPGPAQICQVSPSPQAHPELPHKPSVLKQMPTLDSSPTSINTATLSSGIGQEDWNPLVTNSCGDQELSAIPACTTEGSSSPQSLLASIQKADCARKAVPTRPAVADEELKEQVAPAHTVFSSAMQYHMVSAVPEGKVPILPFTRVKTTEVGKVESDANNAELSSSGCRTNGDERLSITERFNAATQIASMVPALHGSKQSACDSAFSLSHKAKPSSDLAKRKGRKRKVPDEVLALQGKRRKCIVGMCADRVQRKRNSSQEPMDQKPRAASRKYRSIMPKPVLVLSALAPLASPVALLQSQAPSSLSQDVLNNTLPPKGLGSRQSDRPTPKPSSVLRNGFSGIKKPWHMCPVCNHHFQFKHHLLDHMNIHTNRRPYSCGICRKTYVRPGSLSAHMKLHHAEHRPKRLVCCEFCAKVFGHVPVYFGHLKEVHRVVISTEPSSSELQPGDTAKNKDRDATVQGPDGPLERETKSSLEEDFLLNQADEVKLQIRCGRCQITAQSFAEIKFHLLHVHGEEIQGRLQEVILPGGSSGAPYQKQHTERRKQVPLCDSVEDSPAFPTGKRLPPPHQNREEVLGESEGGQWGVSGPPHPARLLWSHSGFNCLLCAQMLWRKEDLLLHWVRQHNCEDPSRLWAILGTFSNQAAPELPSGARQ